MKYGLRSLWICGIVLALVFCVTVAASANTLTGMVMEVSQEGVALHTREGIRFAAVDTGTAWEIDGMPTVGDVVTVQFSGSTNRRTVHADAIICYRIRGTVSEIVDSAEPYLILIPDDENEAVRVNLGDIPPHTVAAGIPVTVFYNGMRTRSVPPQITADYIRGTAFRGTVTGITDSDEIRFLKEDGETVLLHISPDAVVLDEPEAGKPIRVSVLPQVRLSIPAQYEVQDILPIYETKERNET